MAEESGLNRRFRENMRREREARGWSQGELAKQLTQAGWAALGHQTTIGRIENGTRPVKLDESVAIAETFGVDLMTMTFEMDAYLFRMTEQTTMKMRGDLSLAGLDYLQQQLELRRAVEGKPEGVVAEDMERAQTILSETPGDAAMAEILGQMEDQGFGTFEEYRDVLHERMKRRVEEFWEEAGEEAGDA